MARKAIFITIVLAFGRRIRSWVHRVGIQLAAEMLHSRFRARLSLLRALHYSVQLA